MLSASTKEERATSTKSSADGQSIASCDPQHVYSNLDRDDVIKFILTSHILAELHSKETLTAADKKFLEDKNCTDQDKALALRNALQRKQPDSLQIFNQTLRENGLQSIAVVLASHPLESSNDTDGPNSQDTQQNRVKRTLCRICWEEKVVQKNPPVLALLLL